jgi:hypothetical protein
MSRLLEHVLHANIYLQPIQFFLVISTNILNIRILCSRALRSSPCTHYFLAYAIFSIIYISIVCPTQILRGFSIDWAKQRIGCKLHFFLLFATPVQANVMLLLATFDRYYSSSKSHLLDFATTIGTTRIIIVIGTLVSAIYMSPMLIIYNLDETSNKCLRQSSTIIYIYTLSQIIFYYILSPISMIVLGFLTIYNIRQQSAPTKPLTVSVYRRRTEGQLALMLLLQVGIHLILVIPFGVTFTMNALVPSTRTSTILAVRYILLTWQQCDYFVSFFLHVLSGSIYRQEFIRMLNSIKRYRLQPIRSYINKRQVVMLELPLVTTSMLLSIERNGKSI